MKEAPKSIEAVSRDLARFVSEKNITHYQTVLDANPDEKTRQLIIQLLADERAKWSLDGQPAPTRNSRAASSRPHYS